MVCRFSSPLWTDETIGCCSKQCVSNFTCQVFINLTVLSTITFRNVHLVGILGCLLTGVSCGASEKEADLVFYCTKCNQFQHCAITSAG